MKALDEKMEDGSLLFAELSSEISWVDLRNHFERIDQLLIMKFVTDGITEAWLDFYYYDQHFTIHCPLDIYLVFAQDYDCPAFMLNDLLAHFRAVMPNGIHRGQAKATSF